MKGIVTVLEELEKLIYKVLLWLILIPKTLFQVFIHPDWAPDYVKQELGEGKSRFDEFLSPVVLVFVVVLLPAVVWNFRPVYGVDLSSPAEDTPSAKRSLDFTATIKFVSAVSDTDGFISTYWSVQQEEYDGQNYYYPTLYTTRFTNNPEEVDSADYFFYPPIDNNTIQDNYADTFTMPDVYYVVVDAYKFDRRGNVIEYYSNEIYVYVPSDSTENVYVTSNRSPNKPDDKPLVERVSNKFKSEETYLLALGLLVPPLLFALATKLLGKESLSEDLLRETFYVHCYYFAPLGFVFWASNYAYYFFTPDMFNHYDLNGYLITWLPTLLAVLWFTSVETYIIAKEREISGRKAFGLVVVCMVILYGGWWFIANIGTSQVQDDTRKIVIWLYPLVAIGFLTAYHWLGPITRRRTATDKKITTGDFILAIATVVVIFGFVVFVLVEGRSVESNVDVNATQQSWVQESIPTLTQIASQQQSTQAPQATEGPAAVQNTSTLLPVINTTTAEPTQLVENTSEPALPAQTQGPETPTLEQASPTDTPTPESQKYYTEEFDTDLKSWPYFLTRGEDSAVNAYLDSGKFYVQLLQVNEKKPWVYFVNNAFTYGDVQIDTFTTNNGVNSNGVGLICRYSSSGWYEFNVSNSGLYTIYAYDAGNRVYNILTSGGSPAINTGLSSNTYGAICQGNNLTLIVNDQEVATIQDIEFNFPDGLIGISVSSPEGLPVSVDFEYVKVSEP